MDNLQSLFAFFSAIPNRFKYRYNAQFTILVFIFFCSSNPFQLPSGVRMHAVETLFSKFPLQIQIVSNTVTMHALLLL